MASRYNVLERMKDKKIPSKMVIERINQKGVKCTAVTFSKAINGKAFSDNAETIAFFADKVVSELEAKLG